MTSFAVTLEPAPQPRLAALALVVHVAAAASPWVAHVAAGPALLMSLAALIGLASTLAAVPGRHHRLAELVLEGKGCRVRIRDGRTWEPAEIGPRSRALASLVFLDIRAGGRRISWLLPRDAVEAGAFRTLKARVRLTC
jgi:hypothetical protein